MLLSMVNTLIEAQFLLIYINITLDSLGKTGSISITKPTSIKEDKLPGKQHY